VAENHREFAVEVAPAGVKPVATRSEYCLGGIYRGTVFIDLGETLQDGRICGDFFAVPRC
jgi:hypothetical protein